MSTAATLPDSLAERYALVCDRIAKAAASSGRREKDVFLVAVTKNADPEQIRALIDLGHKDLGENRVQQLIHHVAVVDEYHNRLKVLPSSKRGPAGTDSLFAPDQDKLAPIALRVASTAPGAGGTPIPVPKHEAGTVRAGGVRWHMIGHLQRNKARKVVDLVRLVHSVDSLRIAEELQAVGLKRDTIIEVLLQVNCSGEASKFGCPVPAAIPMAEQLDSMVNLRLRGLMTIAAEGATEYETRSAFSRCREIHDEIKAQGIGAAHFNLLSMGMSGDFETAIREGANIVRVGSAIFGEAKVPDPVDEPEEPDEGEGEAET